MARLAAIENALYYPTPTSEIFAFLNHVSFYSNNLTIFDPCAGEGTALKALVSRLTKIGNGNYEIRAIGVELEELRAEKAKEKLNKVVHAPIERVSFASAPKLIFMNPPYDEIDGKRVEIEWINRMASIMDTGGYMILVLPDRFFEGGKNHNDLRGCLYRNMLVPVDKGEYAGYDNWKFHGGLRFTDDNYDAFKQVFLVVKKNSYRRMAPAIPVDGIIGKASNEIVIEIDRSSFGPMKDEFDVEIMDVPPEKSIITESSLEQIFGTTGKGIPVTPLMPMRPEIAAAVIAGGMFSGVQIGSEVIRGGITVRTEKNVVEDGDSRQIEEYDVMVANLSSLDLLTGDIMTWDSDTPEFGERINQVAPLIMEKLEKENPSVFQPEDLEKYRHFFSDIHAPRAINGVQNGLFKPQIEKVGVILKGWENLKSINLIGQMGTGKSITSIAAAVAKVRNRKDDAQKVVILIPAKEDLLKKWINEIKASCRDIPHKVFEINTISDAQKAFSSKGLTFIMVKESMAKRTSGWEHVGRVYGSYSKRKCFNCGKQIDFVNAQGNLIEKDDETRFCPECNAMHKTYVRDRHKNAYSSIARYINDRFKNSYVLIIDEAHQFKGGDSARGYASASLIRGSWRSLIMTGTFYNGYASSIFYTLYRSQGSFRANWDHSSANEFIRMYGLEKRITKQTKSSGYSWSGYSKSSTRTSEIPGIHPSMIAMMLPYTVFMKLDEFNESIPAQRSHTVFFDLPEDVERKTTNFLAKVKDQAISEMKNKKDSSMSLLSQFHWANKGLYDVYPEGDWVDSKELGRMELDSLYHRDMAPKEEAALRIVLGEKRKQLPTLIYYTQTDRRPIHDRLSGLFKKHDVKLTYMPSTEKERVKFVKKALDSGSDVILCNPNLVREGIDLLEFKAIIWYGVTDDAILVDQANARNHRIGQDSETDVYYFGYNKTYQSDRWVSIGRKVSAMSAIHGDVQQGIAALLGDKNLISTIQETVIEFDRAASDLTMDDLPRLDSDVEVASYDVIEEPPIIVELPDDVVQMAMF